MSSHKKESLGHLRVFEEFFKQKTTKIDLNSLIIQIEKTEKLLTDKARMGLINENFSNNYLQEEVKKLISKPDDISIDVTATSKIVKGKKNIVAVNYDEAGALGLIYGINLFDNPDSIRCYVSANNQKCKAILKISPKVPSLENFVLVSKALAKKMDLKNKDEITFNNIKFDTKRVNLDKIDTTDSDYGWGDGY